MKASIIPVTLMIATAANAQVLNGSFEDALGNADLSHWNAYCTLASATSTAPGAGNWCARADAGNVKSCFPGLYYQTLPSVADGAAFTLGGWCHNMPGLFQPVIGIWFGHRDAGGIVQLQSGSTTTNSSWTYVSLVDTFNLGVGDTAAVILDASTLAGPAFAQSEFDGIVLEAAIPEGFADPGPLQVQYLYDAQDNTLHLHLMAGALGSIGLFDLTGRSMVPPVHSTAANAAVVDASSLPAGVYFVQIASAKTVVRFMKQ